MLPSRLVQLKWIFSEYFPSWNFGHFIVMKSLIFGVIQNLTFICQQHCYEFTSTYMPPERMSEFNRTTRYKVVFLYFIQKMKLKQLVPFTVASETSNTLE